MEGLQAILSHLRGMPARCDVADAQLETILNEECGELTGYDCPICKNRGFLWHVEDGEKWTERCKCMETRAGMNRLRRSGLEAAAKNCRLDTFHATEEWQKTMLDTAKRFLADRDRQWLFVSGQTGCGKTHICTAVAVKLLRAGANVRYAQWNETVQRLQACRFDDEAYAEIIEPLKRCQVLYIDDLFKTASNKPPTDADFRAAFELLNARYNSPKLITIISTEHSLRDLYAFDAAMAGRIAERCGKYRVQIAVKPGRNYRERFLGGEV